MLDHDAASLELISQAFAGQPGGLTRDDVLDNITLFWLTNTAISASRLYAENKFSFFGVKGVKIPVAVSVFPDELYQAPRSWARTRVSQADPLQQAQQRRALRRLGTAAALLGRGARRLQITPLVRVEGAAPATAGAAPLFGCRKRRTRCLLSVRFA